jgi:hypothetical protein
VGAGTERLTGRVAVALPRLHNLFHQPEIVNTVAEQIVINAGVAGSKSANSLVQKYGKLVTVFVQLAKRAVINIWFTLILAGFHNAYFTRLFVDFFTWIGM